MAATSFSVVMFLAAYLPEQVHCLSGLHRRGAEVTSHESELDRRRRASDLTMAICMSGPARTLLDKDVHEAFDANVRGSGLAKGLFGDSPDLYMYLKTGDSVRPNGPHMEPDPVDANTLNEVVQILRPTSVKIVPGVGTYDVSDREQLDGFLHDSRCFSTGFFEDPRNVGRNMNMFEGYKNCHAMLEEHEAKAEAKYDVVMFTRPDVLWQASMPKEIFFHNKAVMASDWWSFVPRSISNDLANVLQDVFLEDDSYPVSCCVNNNGEGVMRCIQLNICIAHNMSGPLTVWQDDGGKEAIIKGVVDAPEDTIVTIGRTAMGEVIKRSDGTIFDALFSEDA